MPNDKGHAGGSSSRTDSIDTDEALQPVDQGIVAVLVQNNRRFRQFLIKRVGNEAIADDILQQKLLAAVEQGRSLNTPENVVAWFYTVLQNAVTDYYRSRSAEEKKYAAYLFESEATGEKSTTAAVDAEMRAEVCECFRSLLPTMKPSYAELIEKMDLAGRSPESIAKELGITQNNLFVRLHRARQALKISLARSCGSCAIHGCLHCTCGQ